MILWTVSTRPHSGITQHQFDTREDRHESFPRRKPYQHSTGHKTAAKSVNTGPSV